MVETHLSDFQALGSAAKKEGEAALSKLILMASSISHQGILGLESGLPGANTVLTPAEYLQVEQARLNAIQSLLSLTSNNSPQTLA